LGYPDPVVDGNVIRVLSRWFYDSTANSSPSDSGEAKESPAQYRSPSKRPDRERAPGAFSTRLTIRESTLERTVQKCAEILMENSVLDPSTHNQSLMELGAMICTPGLPSCAVCPVQNHCYAFLSGGPALASDIPAVKKARRQDLDLTLYWVHSVRGVLLIRNPERPILRQDWLLPCKIESLDLPVYIDEVPGVFSMQKEGLLQAVPIRKSSRPSGQPSVKGKPGSTRDAREGTKPGSSRVREFSHSIMNYRIRARVHRIALEAATFESSQNPIVAPDRCAEDSDPKRQFLWVPEKEVHRYCPSSLIKKAVQRIDGDF
ncbi:MAG: hypothetical protein KDK25_15830, partial [Leptospiraceae bacterium]|nr:hypothetical protein [Leptospiraceae bacterium]